MIRSNQTKSSHKRGLSIHFSIDYASEKQTNGRTYERGNVRRYKCTKVGSYEGTKVRMYECTKVRRYEGTNEQPYERTNAQKRPPLADSLGLTF